ncbi:methylated-DNA--[protein]-cysteine S-methyltransferase [Candidatus Kinetoplastidibacterium crithidiae]|uniref:methylated-DNA--[protein]-cysteine S-methyltransferase n=1 Tax=Candidatus Kinetoplastidibacterium crithidiae TCC036E TaxID=1208918 RepID=M1LXK0_9PROT|nr:methylated-DNA--[protein]-cysteine S-methyltransferase [Candidatus Kinetoplastibacterium crithidii]AFZ82934.1 methylated-DNA--protein-cysteine methyltransferase [Candidatus Kinetoplastibacterium crithidii (ex Angomonas deanei ATCC 30255)]AGF47934.1 methylated-DNA-[protein]-cysteine S-methyltransferase [Candidatus Kinetoplastibacterium crithidii TCC036E]
MYKFYKDDFTPLGPIRIVSSENSIVGAYFLDSKSEKIKDHSMIRIQEDNLLDHAILELKQWFLGDRTSFSVPLKPYGTSFQNKVWESLSTIPFGMSVSYGDIARNIGINQAYRAVGTAISKNPIVIFIPCHRVIGKNNQLKGFAQGLWRKKVLLYRENFISYAYCRKKYEV